MGCQSVISGLWRTAQPGCIEARIAGLIPSLHHFTSQIIGANFNRFVIICEPTVHAPFFGAVLNHWPLVGQHALVNDACGHAVNKATASDFVIPPWVWLPPFRSCVSKIEGIGVSQASYEECSFCWRVIMWRTSFSTTILICYHRSTTQRPKPR